MKSPGPKRARLIEITPSIGVLTREASKGRCESLSINENKHHGKHPHTKAAITAVANLKMRKKC